MTINEIQDLIIEEFELFDDWEDRYRYLIDLGRELPLFSEEYKKDQNLVSGCQSKVWLYPTYDGHNLIFDADSDADIPKGLLSLMIRVMSNHPPEDIMNADIYFIDKIGLKDHLSPTRSNGLYAMIKQMKYFALAYSTNKIDNHG